MYMFISIYIIFFLFLNITGSHRYICTYAHTHMFPIGYMLHIVCYLTVFWWLLRCFFHVFWFVPVDFFELQPSKVPQVFLQFFPEMRDGPTAGTKSIRKRLRCKKCRVPSSSDCWVDSDGPWWMVAAGPMFPDRSIAQSECWGWFAQMSPRNLLVKCSKSAGSWPGNFSF